MSAHEVPCRFCGRPMTEIRRWEIDGTRWLECAECCFTTPINGPVEPQPLAFAEVAHA